LSHYRYSKILSCALYGIDGVNVEIEVSILPGLSSFEVVGLGDCAIRESRNRVHAAIKNNGYSFPSGRITVSMAPGFIRKEGTAFDLPIAIGILEASGQIKIREKNVSIAGEMSLSGEVRAIPGTINRILTAHNNSIGKIIVPFRNLNEGILIKNIDVYGVNNLTECIDYLETKDEWKKTKLTENLNFKDTENYCKDISSVIGQPGAVRAIKIAATGRHNVMMTGSPGCGKTMIASVLPGILPPLREKEKIEVAKIYSSCGLLKFNSIMPLCRPFRSPHHNSSITSITGGGHYPNPGEITLAHTGVLFMDEMNEFPSKTLDMLRQPLEEHTIKISRNRYNMEYPADFMLIGAANPCRCGNLLERNIKSPCKCTPIMIEKHMAVISGPILDRIDMFIEIIKIPEYEIKKSLEKTRLKESESVRQMVESAWEKQFKRCIKNGVKPSLNSRLPAEYIFEVFELEKEVVDFAGEAANNLSLSVRSYQKLIRVARSIADFDGNDLLEKKHIAQALQYRRKTNV